MHHDTILPPLPAKARKRAATAIGTALHVGPARAHNLADGADPGHWQRDAVDAIIGCYRQPGRPATALAVAAVYRGLYPTARIFDLDDRGFHTVRADGIVLTVEPDDWSTLRLQDADGPGQWTAPTGLHPAEHDPRRIARRLVHAAAPDHDGPYDADTAALIAEVHTIEVRGHTDVVCPVCLPALTGDVELDHDGVYPARAATVLREQQAKLARYQATHARHLARG